MKGGARVNVVVGGEEGVHRSGRTGRYQVEQEGEPGLAGRWNIIFLNHGLDFSKFI